MEFAVEMETDFNWLMDAGIGRTGTVTGPNGTAPIATPLIFFSYTPPSDFIQNFPHIIPCISTVTGGENGANSDLSANITVPAGTDSGTAPKTDSGVNPAPLPGASAHGRSAHKRLSPFS